MKPSLTSHPATSGGRVCLNIADIVVALKWSNPDLSPNLTEATQQFLVETPDSDVTVTADWGEKHHFDDVPEDSMLFDSGALWKLYDQGGHHHFRFTSETFGPLPYKVATFSPDYTSGQVYLNREVSQAYTQWMNPLEYPLDELIVTHVLSQGGGVEVHACGLVGDSGHGYLFLGQSGAGKTTISRIWQNHAPGVTILSDDRIVLRKVGNGIWMYGTPWHGEGDLSCAAQVQVTSIFFLKHGNTNQCTALSQTEMTTRLFACCFPPFHSPSGLSFTLGFLEEVAQAVPGWELSFMPDKRVISLIGQHGNVLN